MQELLWHSAGLQRPAVEPVIGMPAGEDGMPRHFRHKASFVFAPEGRARTRTGRWGTTRTGRAVSCRSSSARCTASARTQLAFALRDHLSRAQVTAAGPRLEGILRHVVIRTTHDDREALVMLVVTRNDKSLRKPLRAFLASEGRPDGLFVTVHDRDDPYMVGDVLLRIDGQTHIRETRLGPRYPAVADGVLPDQPGRGRGRWWTKSSRRRPRDGRPPSGLHVLDLYAGSGLFALPLARAGHTVTAVEENRQAVKDGIANAALNRIPQTRVALCDRTNRGLSPPHASHTRPGRARPAAPGMRAVGDSSASSGSSEPQRVIYVSCNPEAFAGELPAMLDAGYTLDRVQPVDMFPHTDHVELVATLSATLRVAMITDHPQISQIHADSDCRSEDRRARRKARLGQAAQPSGFAARG